MSDAEAMWPEEQIATACWGPPTDTRMWAAWLAYARDNVPWRRTTDTFVNVRYQGFVGGWTAALGFGPR